MGKTAFKTFATFTVLLLIVATAFTLIFGLCDAHIFAPLDIASATSAETSAADNYYASVENLTTDGASFRSSLAKLITSTHKSQPTYQDLIKVFPNTDANPENKSQMLWFYTGTVAKSGTNREHVWPKDGGKAFPEETYVGSDAHHLRPTDSNLNSSRQSLSFGEVPQTTGNIVKEYGSTTYDNLCYKTGQYFYPGVGYRGATARILMYVETRWGDAYNLQFVLGDGKCKTIGDIETLMKWHLEEPVTDAERLRNDEVQKIQGNRNPFIDHPEYAAKIYCNDGQNYNSVLQQVVADHEGTEPIEGLSFESESISLAVGETTTLSPTYTPEKAKRDVTWTSSDTDVATIDENGKVTAKANGTTTITVTSNGDTSIKATLLLTVKSVDRINVSGQPSKTTYNEGESFKADGVSVTAHFTDGSTKTIDNGSCQWVDSVTGNAILSAGTPSVICKFTSNGQTFEDSVNGITVIKINGDRSTITLDKTSAGGKYGWYGWSAGGLSGQGFMYKGTKPVSIQINGNQNRKCYFYNTTALPSPLISIKIKLVEGDGKSFDIYTSDTPYTSTQTAFPTSGTKRGTLTADSNGVTLAINTTDKYFTINYNGSNACYIESIEILYGEQEAECEHAWSDWTTTVEPSYTQKGTQERTCSVCNQKETRDVSMLVCNHDWSDWTTTKEASYTEIGSKERTCSECGEKETAIIPMLVCDHTKLGWTTVKEATYTEKGLETRTCATCGQTETREIPMRICTHDWPKEWTTIKAATYTEKGVEVHTCKICNKTETREIPKLVCTNHNWGDGWTVSKEPTYTQKGTEKRTCSICNKIETREIAKLECTDHTYGKWTIIKEPTETADGAERHSCTKCGYSEQHTIKHTSFTADDFLNAVNAIESAKTAKEKQEAISNAETIYNALYSTVKQDTTVQSALSKLNAQKTELDSSSGTLSPGAIAGIAVGSAAFVCIVCVVVIILVKKNKAKVM